MSISPISYSSYNNSINIRKNLKNNSQIPENQVAFKGLEKVATKTSQEALTKNSGKILAALTALVVTTMASLGIKTKKEKMIEKEFDTVLSTTGFSKLKESNPDSYKEVLKIYSENPELVKGLVNKYISYEHLDCNHDHVTSYDQRYSCADIIAIYEIDKIDPTLTPLAKKAFGGQYYSHLSYGSQYKAAEITAEVKKAILNEPEKVKKVLKEFEKTKVFYDYLVSENYYTVEDLLKEIKEYDTKTAIAFKEAKQKAQDKFGIEITEVIADSHPSKGDCDLISYTFEGKEQKCYLPAPPGGRTETEVLETFIKEYNSVDEFRSVPIIDYSRETINF